MPGKKIILPVALFICLLVSTGFIDCDNETVAKVIGNEVKRTAYLGMIRNYMPGLTYYAKASEKKTKTNEFMEKLASDIFPLYGYMKAQSDYTPPSESELSYEAILEREALDESYVDGELKTAIRAAENENQLEVLHEAETENAKKREEDKKEYENKPEEAQSNGEEKQKSQETVAVSDQMIDNFPIQTQPVVNYPIEKLNDFDYLIQTFYTVDRTTTINSSQLNAGELLARDMHITAPADQPQILIYHTHAHELYADSNPEDLMTGVMGCGEYLAQILREKYGLNVLHHMGVYDDVRKYAYANAAPDIEQILAQNPSIEVIIDVHRDEISQGTHIVRTVQGQPMAPIMFFNGLSRLTGHGDIDYLANQNIMDNLAFSLQMQLKAAEYYPDFTRHIYLKGYRYNMQYRPKTLLIETGFQTNTFQESRNAMAPLADILHKVLCE